MTTPTRIARPVIAAAAVLAVMAPAAQARPFADSANAAAAVRATNGAISPTIASLPPDRADGLGSTRLPTVPQPAVVVRTTSSGDFSWADAGLGAASGLAAGIIAVGGAMAVRGRRRLALPS